MVAYAIIDCVRRNMERSAPVARKTPNTTGSHSQCGTPASASTRCDAAPNRPAAVEPVKFMPATASNGSSSASPTPSVSELASAIATVAANARGSTPAAKRTSPQAVSQVEPASADSRGGPSPALRTGPEPEFDETLEGMVATLPDRRPGHARALPTRAP
jgi:hypothetical protein